MSSGKASLIRIDIKRPAECSEAELKLFRNFVIQGDEVAEEGLHQRILSAEALALAYEGEHLVGVAALKVPNPRYRQNTFLKAKTRLDPEQFPREMGWVFVDPQHRERKISHRLVQTLVATSHSSIYATSRTLNKPMHRTLERTGFVRHGSEFPSDMNPGEKLTFFARVKD